MRTKIGFEIPLAPKTIRNIYGVLHRCLHDAQVDERIPDDRRLRYALMFLTGARFGEIVELRWSDYDATATPLGSLTVSAPTTRSAAS